MVQDINEDAGNAVRDLLQEYVVSPMSTEMDGKLRHHDETLDTIKEDIQNNIKSNFNGLLGRVEVEKQTLKEIQDNFASIEKPIKDINKNCNTSKWLCQEIKQAQESSQMRISRQNERICGKIERNAMNISKYLVQIQQTQRGTDQRIKNDVEVLGSQYKDLQKRIEDTKNTYKQGNDDVLEQISNSQKLLNQSVQENFNKQQDEMYEKIQTLIGDIDRKLIFETVIQHLDKVEKQGNQNREGISQSILKNAEKEEEHQKYLEATIERNFKDLGNIMESQHNAVNAVLEKKYGILLKITLLLGGMDLIGVIVAIVMQIM